MASRTGKTVKECVIWYNGTTGKHTESPYEMIFRPKPRLPIVREMRVIECTTDVSLSNSDDENDYGVLAMNPFKINDRIYLRSTGKCDDPWTGPHKVSNILSVVTLELDNKSIARHISHMRKVEDKSGLADEGQMQEGNTDSSDTESDSETAEGLESSGCIEQQSVPAAQERIKRLPRRYDGYEFDRS